MNIVNRRDVKENDFIIIYDSRRPPRYAYMGKCTSNKYDVYLIGVWCEGSFDYNPALRNTAMFSNDTIYKLTTTEAVLYSGFN